jgi:hypothetical protein
VENKDRDVAKRSRVSIIIGAASMLIAGFVVYLVQLDVSSSIDWRCLLTRKPSAAVILAGFLLMVVSGFTLIFRGQMGSWFASLARWGGIHYA